MSVREELQDLWRRDRTILSAIAVSLLLGPAIFFYQMWLGYQQQLEIAENTTRNVAILLDAEMSATLRRVEGTLQELVDTTPAAALQPAAEPRFAQQINRGLDANLFRFAELNGLRITDANGNVLYSTASATTPRANIGDRPYFKQLREGNEKGLVFSDVIFGRTAKRWVLVVAKAIRNDQGEFLGAAYALLAIDQLQELFLSLHLGSQSVIELRRRDNHLLLARWPAMTDALNQPPADGHPIRALGGAVPPFLSYHLTDALDGIERIHSLRPVGGYPWLVEVGLGRDQALAEWRMRTWLVAAAMLLFQSLALMALDRFFKMRRHELRTHDTLRHSEQRFRQLFDINAAIMLWVDPTDTRIVDANQAAITFYGYPAERLIGMRIHEINILPADEIAARMRERRADGVSRLEFRHRLANGAVRDVEVYTTTLDFSGKQLLYCIIHDITERHRAETALREERDHSQMYLDLVETVIIELDKDARVVSINRKGCELLGQPQPGLIGQNWIRLSHADDTAEPVLSDYRRVIAGEQPIAEYYEAPLPRADGRMLQIVWRSALLHDRDGQVTGMLIAGTDITERKQAEDVLTDYRASLERQVAERTTELDRLNRRLTLATRAANIGVWEWELATDQIYWNEQMSEIYGVPHEPVMPAAVRTRAVLPEDLSYVANNMQAILASSGEGNAGEAGEFRIIRPSGELRHLYSTGTVVRDEHGKVVRAVGINLDITERKQIEIALCEARDTAEASDRAKSEFLANVTHELRTPLNAVIGLTNLASDLCADAKQRDYLNKILLSGKHLNRLINDLLDLAKIAAGHLEIESQPFSPSALIVRCNSVMAHRAAAKGLTLRETIADDVPTLLLGDPLRIEQILLNLVGNALKFTLAGQVEVRIATFARADDHIGLEISVQDTGIGMSASDLSRLFKPFSQADATVSRRFGGTGLGLMISKRLAELMGGDVTVTSEPGIGSTFTVRLWLHEADPASLPLPVAEPQQDHASDIHYRDAHVLVVEDQPLNREIVEALLNDVGITVATADNGQDALYILKKSGPETFDLVLMDIQMPIMDGLTTTRELRRWAGFGRLPIIAMTAHTMAHEKEEALSAGMNDHIGKPFDNVQFLNTLARWISRTKQDAPTPTEHVPAAATNPPAASDIPSRVEIGGLDWAHGLSHFNGREDRYRHWLADFATTSDAAVASIRARLEAGDHSAAAALAHTLKGRAGMLGMSDLHQHVSELEMALRDGSNDDTGVARLETAIGQMCSQLQAALTPVADVAPEPTAAPTTPAVAAQPWDDTLSVGNATLDSQHQELFAITNELVALHAAWLRSEDVSGKLHEVLARLSERGEQHFRCEEDYLRSLGYPGLADHEKEHAALLTMLAAHAAPLGELDIRSAHQTLQQALRRHILESDTRYRRYIDECNLNY